MSLITEKRDVQDQLINYLMGIGWSYLSPATVARVRSSDQEPFLPDIARQQLMALNPGLVTAANVDDVLRRLRLVRPNLAGNEDVLKALRGHWTVAHPKEKREYNLTLLAYVDLAANQFHFTQELPFEDYDRRRPDLVLYVNGLPLVIVENKSPTVKEPEVEAFDQVQTLYTRDIPGLLKYVQFFAACDLRLHYAPTWNDSLKAFYKWKVDGKDYGLERLSKTMFDRAHLLNLIQDYLIFYRADDQTHKFVLRPHQIRATERVVVRVVNGKVPSGLVWHTQGSGKTLSMIVTAHKLRRLEQLQNPTILIVVDRLELEAQMSQNLDAFGFPLVRRAESKRHLTQLLRSNYRGVIVTTIHKFDQQPKDLNRRENVIVLIDEAHRTQEGNLGIFMRAALPKAFYFGYTGTPIDKGKIGQGTFEKFGKHDPEGYQDKYGIDEAIEDGATVRLWYTLAPSELRVDRDTLQREFHDKISDAASIEELNRMLDRAEPLKSVIKAGDRVQGIAAHLAEHFTSNVTPRGFKAMLVAIDREACALYKQALDQYLPDDYSTVVYTANPKKDTDLMRQQYLDEDTEKRVRKDFRDPEKRPKILIVTEKLLTGYDAPVLYCMYLDKPMKDHTLLQAIARINRPYPDKDSGLLLDYVGIFEDLQKALAFDQAAVSKALVDLAELKRQFADLLNQAEAMLSPLDLDKVAGRDERIIEYFFDQDRRDEGRQQFKALQTAYEVISPDPFLYDYLSRYAMVAQVHTVVYNYFSPQAQRAALRRDLLKKTDQLIRENVQRTSLTSPLPLYPINKDIGHVVAADQVSEQVKVINLYRSLLAHIQANEPTQPYLIPIADEVEAIIQRLRERQISVEEALRATEQEAQRVIQAEAERQKSSLEDRAFAISWVLKGYSVAEPETKALEVQDALDNYPGWPYNQQLEGEVRMSLYRILISQPAPVPRIAEKPGTYSVTGQGGGIADLKALVDNILRMSNMVGA
jgi:type I restriction enzyme, R subunit